MNVKLAIQWFKGGKKPTFFEYLTSRTALHNAFNMLYNRDAYGAVIELNGRRFAMREIRSVDTTNKA